MIIGQIGENIPSTRKVIRLLFLRFWFKNDRIDGLEVGFVQGVEARGEVARLQANVASDIDHGVSTMAEETDDIFVALPFEGKRQRGIDSVKASIF